MVLMFCLKKNLLEFDPFYLNIKSKSKASERGQFPVLEQKMVHLQLYIVVDKARHFLAQNLGQLEVTHDDQTCISNFQKSRLSIETRQWLEPFLHRPRS